MATPEQWEVQEKFAPESEDAACLLELRYRVERLELGAGIYDAVIQALKHDVKSTPNSEKIRSSLVERVSKTIDGRINPDQWLHMETARATILEVAAWLDEIARFDDDPVCLAAALLRCEAER